MAADPDGGRSELRGMWQLPSTWRVLRLLATPLAYAPPAPDDFEDALLSPFEHEAVIASMHGRLVGLAAGKSSEARWIGHVSRFMRAFPGTFGQILGNVPLASSEASGSSRTGVDNAATNGPNESGIGKLGDSVSAVANVGMQPLKVFKTMEEYAELSPKTRLLLLHAMAELVICEHDTLLLVGQLASVDHNEMRLEPVGYDAVGSAYWYFGDEHRLYREPNPRAVRAAEARARAEARAAEARAKAEQRAAEKLAAEQRGAERESRKRKDVAMRQQATRASSRKSLQRASKDRWAATVGTGRATRSSIAKERGTRGQTADVTKAENGRPRRSATKGRKTSGTKDSDGDFEMESPKNALSGDEADGDGSFEDDPGADDAEGESDDDEENASGMGKHTGSGRGSGRRGRKSETGNKDSAGVSHGEPSGRKRESDDMAVDTSGTKKRRVSAAGKFEDPELRFCEGWELVCSGPVELMTFIERFPAKIKNLAERHLITRLREELHPVMKEAQNAVLKEEEKRVRSEWLITNQKRSSRVSALERRKQEEEEAALAREEEEAALERARKQEETRLARQVAALQADLVRELRFARHGLASKSGDIRSTTPSAPPRAPSRTQRALRRGSGEPSAGDSQNGHMSDATAESDRNRQEVLVAAKDEKSPQASAAEERVSSPQEPEDVGGKASGSGAADDLPPTDASAVEDREHTSSVSIEGVPGRGLSCACPEPRIPEHMTWQILPDDKLPTRALTSFVFVDPETLESVSLQETERDSEDTEERQLVVGFGIITPPPDSGLAPLCVHIGVMEEWVIEYGRDPRLWARTNRGWYELTTPLPEYSNLFAHVLARFEICVRLSILGQTMRAEHLTYDDVVEMLAMRYMDMRSYKEAEILGESEFIVAQMNNLAKPAISKSGFMKQLRKHVGNIEKRKNRELDREARAAAKSEISKIRSKHREAEKEREVAYRAEIAAEKEHAQAEKKRRRLETSLARQRRTSEDGRKPVVDVPISCGIGGGSSVFPAVPGCNNGSNVKSEITAVKTEPCNAAEGMRANFPVSEPVQSSCSKAEKTEAGVGSVRERDVAIKQEKKGNGGLSNALPGLNSNGADRAWAESGSGAKSERPRGVSSAPEADPSVVVLGKSDSEERPMSTAADKTERLSQGAADCNESVVVESAAVGETAGFAHEKSESAQLPVSLDPLKTEQLARGPKHSEETVTSSALAGGSLSKSNGFASKEADVVEAEAPNGAVRGEGAKADVVPIAAASGPGQDERPSFDEGEKRQSPAAIMNGCSSGKSNGSTGE